MSESLATDLSLISRVRRRDEVAWDDFATLYGPLVYEWARREGLQPSDARDVSQEVFHSVLSALDRWEPGRFRSWLWTIFRRRVMDYYRRAAKQPRAAGGSTANLQIREIAESPPDEVSVEGSREMQALRRRALEIVGDKIDEKQWEAFYRIIIEGDAPTDVAADLGVSKWAVYKAKSRVLRRLLQEFDGLEFLTGYEKAARSPTKPATSPRLPIDS